MSLLSTSLFIDLAILIVCLFGFLYWLTTKNFDHWRNKGVQYEEPQAFFGNLRDLVLVKKSMGEVLSKIYFRAKGQPYVGMFGFHRPILLIRDLDLVKRILVKDFSNFRDRTFNADEERDPMFVKNLFGMNGPRWRNLRVKLTPTFTSGKMKLMYEFVHECGLDLVNYVEHSISGGKGVLEVKDALARYTTDTIASCGFGLKCNSLQNPDAEFRRILRKVVDFDFWRGIKASCSFFAPELIRLFRLRVMDYEVTEFLRRIVWETVEQREKSGYVRRDFLDLLMQLKKKGFVDSDTVINDKQEHGDVHSNGEMNGSSKIVKYDLDGDDFVAQAFVFLTAGFETSSSTLTFCLYELARHPEHQRKLREEVREAMKKEGKILSYETLQALPFMQQVVQETLRLYPALPFLDREVVEDYHIPGSDVILEKGSSVMIPLLGIHRNPEYFQDPDVFRPERFSEENKKDIPAYAYMPFGEGPRICIGMRMAYMQVKVGLAHFINRFEVSPCSKTLIPLELDPKSFLLASNGGMPLTITKLNDAIL